VLKECLLGINVLCISLRVFVYGVVTVQQFEF
jgi:hypothetical protein